MHMMQNTRPNLLWIMADQLRADCFGAAGNGLVRTPHIDLLAAGGVRFTHAYTPLPVCSPARQALLHGRRPESFGALWNAGIALPVPSLPPDAFVWPRALSETGYRCAFFGKWGVHPEHSPLAYGYERYAGERDYRSFLRANEEEASYSYTNGFFGETSPVPVGRSPCHWFADRAIETIRQFRKEGTPWHVALHFPEPHPPCRPSGEFAGMYKAEDIPEWPSFRETFDNKPYIQKQQLHSWQVDRFEWPDWAPVVARYFGVISQLDAAVGRVLEALEEEGGANDTLVVFTSDHGDLCGAHRMMDKHYVLYDDVVRVPLVMRWPGRIAPGSVRDEFVLPALDAVPAILQLAGLQPPSGLHGRSLLELLDPDTAPAAAPGAAERSPGAEPWRDAVVSTYNGQQFGLYTQRMIRTREWKYIWNTTDVDELYDMVRDPAELVNKIYDPGCSGALSSLRRRLYEILLAEGDGLVATDWTKRQLLSGCKL